MTTKSYPIGCPSSRGTIPKVWAKTRSPCPRYVVSESRRLRWPRWLLYAAVLISLVWLSAPAPLFSQNELDRVTRLPFVSRNHPGFQVTWVTVRRVIDGDTIELASGARVRYIGIDTPEMSGPRECYATEATAKNRELVEGKRVALRKDVSETDRYGRLLRYVYLPTGEMVNATLVREGYAVTSTFPPDVMFADLFVELEREAREAARGLWGPACETPTTPTLTPIPSVTPGPDPAGVRVNGPCSQFDAPGDDHYNLNEEWVCFTNYGGESSEMTRWQVRDEYGHTHIFSSFTLASGATVRLHTGAGANTQADLYWGSSSAIWNNDGDTVYLWDAAGNRVDEYLYP